MAKVLIKGFVVLYLLSAFGCASHKPQGYVKLIDKSHNIPTNTLLYVKVPEGIATFIGKAPSYSGTTQNGGMVYPGATPVDFFVGVLAHAAINESIKNNQKNELQAYADKVLEPYKKYSDSLKNKMLIKQLKDVALSRGFTLNKYNENLKPDDLILDITPIYLLNKTEDTLILRNQFLVYKKKYENKSSKKKQLLFQNQIEVISGNSVLGEPQEYWLKNDGEILKAEMSLLFSESLNLIAKRISDRGKDSNKKFKNYRYNDGDNVVFERATPLIENCEKVVFKTLRGWLKSIPTKRIVDFKECPNQSIVAI